MASITFGETVIPTLSSRLSLLPLRDPAFLLKKGLYSAEVATGYNNEFPEGPMLQGSDTVRSGGPTSPAERKLLRWSLKQPLLQWHPNLLTMNSDNTVAAKDSLVILMNAEELPEA